MYGHGQMECLDDSAKRMLDHTFRHDRMPSHLQCTVDGCMHRHTHTSAAHQCHQCHLRGGLHRAWCGRADLAAPEDVPASPSSPFLNTAATPLSPVRTKCPICRTNNTIVGAPSVVYTAADCVVCMEKEPLVVFPDCHHACVCCSCLEKL